LKGSGAIACLIFGLILRNCKDITKLIIQIKDSHDEKEEKNKEKQDRKVKENHEGFAVTTPEEELFYSQISFFVKTFFFVYIGLLIDIHNTNILIIGGIISLVVMLARQFSAKLTKKMPVFDRGIISSTFARGLAAAAIAQLLVISGIPNSDVIVQITYTVITFTIFLSSIYIFLAELKIYDVTYIDHLFSRKNKKKEES
jgi:NhaP-type Na+/H+ or K+/H+ antiporter